MRTRLDGIVEEAIAAWPELREPQKLSVIKVVALSCFRHGVEMDRAHSWIGEPASAVQPALTLTLSNTKTP